MDIGVSTACLYPELLENALDGLLEGGVKNLEIFINTHSELQEDYLKRLKNKLDNYDAKAVSLHPFTCGIESMMLFTPYQRRVDDILEYYKNYFNAMNILGAKIFVFHGNYSSNIYNDEDYFNRYLSLYKLGKEFGVTVAQENIARCTSGNLSFLKKMSNVLGDNAKFVLDLKQARRYGMNPLDYINELKGKIIHIHYSDGNSQEDCAKFNCGKFDNKMFYDKLIQNNIDCNIILELYRNNFKNINDLCRNFFEMRYYFTSLLQ